MCKSYQRWDCNQHTRFKFYPKQLCSINSKGRKKNTDPSPFSYGLNTRKERLHFFTWQPIQEKEIPEWCHTARVGFSLYPRVVMSFTISEAVLTTWHFTQLLHFWRNGESVGREHYILLLLVCAVSLQDVDDYDSPPCSVASSSSAISPKSHPLMRTRNFNCFWRISVLSAGIFLYNFVSRVQSLVFSESFMSKQISVVTYFFFIRDEIVKYSLPYSWPKKDF